MANAEKDTDLLDAGGCHGAVPRAPQHLQLDEDGAEGAAPRLPGQVAPAQHGHLQAEGAHGRGALRVEAAAVQHLERGGIPDRVRVWDKTMAVVFRPNS